jgi:hypothetical protein
VAQPRHGGAGAPAEPVRGWVGGGWGRGGGGGGRVVGAPPEGVDAPVCCIAGRFSIDLCMLHACGFGSCTCNHHQRKETPVAG